MERPTVEVNRSPRQPERIGVAEMFSQLQPGDFEGDKVTQFFWPGILLLVSAILELVLEMIASGLQCPQQPSSHFSVGLWLGWVSAAEAAGLLTLACRPNTSCARLFYCSYAWTLITGISAGVAVILCCIVRFSSAFPACQLTSLFFIFIICLSVLPLVWTFYSFTITLTRAIDRFSQEP